MDRLKSEYRSAPWFVGIRAYWDGHRDEIRIEVQVLGTAAHAAIPRDLLGRAIHFRPIAAANR